MSLQTSMIELFWEESGPFAKRPLRCFASDLLQFKIYNQKITKINNFFPLLVHIFYSNQNKVHQIGLINKNLRMSL